MMMRMLSLCSGIGGAEIAASWTQKIEVVGQVENNPFCIEVLKKQYPDVPRIENLEDVQGDEFGHVDICISGFPCQPHSVAGMERGSEDKRDLWPEVYRILSLIRPRWFVGENVPGLLHSRYQGGEKGSFFKKIICDLASLGYRVGWCVCGAYEVGAPHKRDRVFIVAYSSGDRRGNGQVQHELKEQKANTGEDGDERIMANATGEGLPQFGRSALATHTTQDTAGMEFQSERFGDVADATGERWREGRPERSQPSGELQAIWCGRVPFGYQSSRELADADEQGLQERDGGAAPRGAHATTTGGDTGAAQSCVGRGTYGFPYWLDRYRWPARPGEAQYEWEPPRVIQEKLVNRIPRLKALGNAIVPQQIYPLLMAIVQVDELIQQQEAAR